MKLITNKKGIFFTIMSMLLISLFIFALTNPPKNIVNITKLESITTRIQSLNDLVNSINDIYIDSIIKITAYNQLKYIAENGVSVDLFIDFETALEADINEQTNVVYWFDKLNLSVDEAYHSSVELTNINIKSLTQQEKQPFEVSVIFDITYNINKANPKLFWDITLLDQIVKVSIINLPDPDNSGSLVLLPPIGSYAANPLGISYLEKLGGATLFDSSKICPGTGCS